MTEPPCRKRFQIHLSTAIVMMFVAGGLWWANLTPLKGTFVVEGENGKNVFEHVIFGWPFSREHENYIGGDIKDVFGDWILPPIAIYSCDVFTALLILLAVRYICEWLIRRRVARKDA
jgi:hypothetical protein